MFLLICLIVIVAIVSGCPLSTFDSKHINTFLPHGEKQYEEFRKSLSEVITNLYI